MITSKKLAISKLSNCDRNYFIPDFYCCSGGLKRPLKIHLNTQCPLNSPTPCISDCPALGPWPSYVIHREIARSRLDKRNITHSAGYQLSPFDFLWAYRITLPLHIPIRVFTHKLLQSIPNFMSLFFEKVEFTL